jgi:hypothetical protein
MAQGFQDLALLRLKRRIKARLAPATAADRD